LKADTVI